MKPGSPLLVAVSILASGARAQNGCSTEYASVTGNGFDVNFYRYPHLDPVGYNDTNFFSTDYALQGGWISSVSGVGDITVLGNQSTNNVYGQEITTDNFTMELSGYFFPQMNGTYTFALGADDGASLQLGARGKQTSCCGPINNTVTTVVHGASTGTFLAGYGGPYMDGELVIGMNLTAGEFYPIRMVYFNWDARFQLNMTVTDPAGNLISDFSDTVKQIEYHISVCPIITTVPWTGTVTSTYITTMYEVSSSMTYEVPDETVYTPEFRTTTTEPWTGSFTTTYTTNIETKGSNGPGTEIEVVIETPTTKSSPSSSSTPTSTLPSSTLSNSTSTLPSSTLSTPTSTLPSSTSSTPTSTISPSSSSVVTSRNASTSTTSQTAQSSTVSVSSLMSSSAAVSTISSSLISSSSVVNSTTVPIPSSTSCTSTTGTSSGTESTLFSSSVSSSLASSSSTVSKFSSSASSAIVETTSAGISSVFSSLTRHSSYINSTSLPAPPPSSSSSTVETTSTTASTTLSSPTSSSLAISSIPVSKSSSSASSVVVETTSATASPIISSSVSSALPISSTPVSKSSSPAPSVVVETTSATASTIISSLVSSASPISSTPLSKSSSPASSVVVETTGATISPALSSPVSSSSVASSVSVSESVPSGSSQTKSGPISPQGITKTNTETYFTTYCPSPTTFTYGSTVYTVSEATTLTVTDCGCTEITQSTAVDSSYNSLASGSGIHSNTAKPIPTVTTELTSYFTTYCPSPTTFTYGSTEYTITEATTLTLTPSESRATELTSSSPESGPQPAETNPSGQGYESSNVPIESTHHPVPTESNSGLPAVPTESASESSVEVSNSGKNLRPLSGLLIAVILGEIMI